MFRRVLNKIHPTVFLRAAKVASNTISGDEQRLIDICGMQPEDALKKLGVTEAGLSEEQVEQARTEFGCNDFGSKKEMGILMELMVRCKNPLVIQLLLICLVSALTGDIPTATIVGGMIFLSVVLGYVQEHRSSKAVEKLQAMV